MSTAFLPHFLSQIGTFTSLTEASPDRLAIDPARCSGFGGADLRVTEEDAAGESGSQILPPFEHGQILTVGGDFEVQSVGMSAEDGYFDALEMLIGSLASSLAALQTAPDDLVWPNGSVKIWQHAKLETDFLNYWICEAVFSLIVDVFA